jgi:hypothetical protein
MCCFWKLWQGQPVLHSNNEDPKIIEGKEQFSSSIRNAVWKPCSALRNSKGGALDRADSALVAQVNEHPHDELNVAFGNRWDIFKQHYFWVQQFHGTQK